MSKQTNELRDLSADELRQLDEALAPEKVSGPRYNERAMKWVDR